MGRIIAWAVHLFSLFTLAVNSHYFLCVVLHGLGLESEHCLIENQNGRVTLIPLNDAQCSVNGIQVTEPCQLNQGHIQLIFHF